MKNILEGNSWIFRKIDEITWLSSQTEKIETIQKVLRARLPAFPHPYLREGQRVRLTAGLLAGAEGILLRTKPNKGLLVLSIELLQRSVAVEVDATLVEPA